LNGYSARGLEQVSQGQEREGIAMKRVKVWEIFHHFMFPIPIRGFNYFWCPVLGPEHAGFKVFTFGFILIPFPGISIFGIRN